MKIVDSKQMRVIEQRSEDAGVSTAQLMDNAGLAVAQYVRDILGAFTGDPIVVLVGPGNNGSDGLVAARHLYTWGARTLVYLCADRPRGDTQLAAVQDRCVPIAVASEDDGLAQLGGALSRATLVVDSVLGTGRSRPLRGTLQQVFKRLAEEASERPELQVVALDLPSGLDADTGAVDEVSPRADVTVTLGYPKVGLFQLPGSEYAGRIEIADIRVPPGLDNDVALELTTPEWARTALPRRELTAHKGTFGRTLVVAGSRNYIGAAYLAASAAGRVGSGLVTLAIPESIQVAVAARAVEPTYLPLPESAPGALSPDAAGLVVERLGEYDALLVGCGLGQANATSRFLEALLFTERDGTPPTVVDADGLNFLAGSQGPPWWERLTRAAVLTPHPGEMARLTGRPSQDIQRRRIGEAAEAAARWHKVVVLKGAYTVVAEPGGNSRVSPFANPGLASAGTGDVLAGAIAGLLSQGLELHTAASLAVYVHGLAADLVRDAIGDTGMLASDVLNALPKAINSLKSSP